MPLLGTAIYSITSYTHIKASVNKSINHQLNHDAAVRFLCKETGKEINYM